MKMLMQGRLLILYLNQLIQPMEVLHLESIITKRLTET